MMEEPTAEATEEATEEPTAEPTEEMTETADILDTITEFGDFDILLSLLDAAGLTETLKTEGPFTLFAPTDAAFAALPAGTIDGLLASSPDDLSQVLLYHLLQGEVMSTDLGRWRDHHHSPRWNRHCQRDPKWYQDQRRHHHHQRYWNKQRCDPHHRRRPLTL